MTRTSRGLAPAVLIVASVLSLSACGSSSSSSVKNVSVTPSAGQGGTHTFNASGFELHFSYPAPFKPATLSKIARQSGGNAHFASVGIDPLDIITVARYPLKISISEANLARIKPLFDRIISRTFSATVSSRTGTLGGLPALIYSAHQVPGLPATDQVNIVFLGNSEYEFACQYTAARRSTMLAACQTALSTLHR